jgi:hypothetical protein
MEYIESAILFAVGTIMIFGNRRIALSTYKKLPSFLSAKIGQLEDQTNWYIMFNRIGIIVVGIGALLASYTVVFGPLHI